MTKAQIEARDKAIDYLREYIPCNGTVYTVLRNWRYDTNGNGVATVSIHVLREGGCMYNISHLVARATNSRFSRAHLGVSCDNSHELCCDLSRVLYGTPDAFREVIV